MTTAERGLRQLIKKYEKKRAKHYRTAGKATKRKDIEGQLIHTSYQLSYTEMQVDLEALYAAVKRHNEH